MSEQENKKVAQAILEAFGRGDIAGLLVNVHEDVAWSAPGSLAVPYHGEKRGHDG